ncbi:TPA: hypothetical protein ACXJSJ_003180 [Pseudomonas aeruginosa]|uniref:hypothetical protein n=1 Tax=Pseudomonas aeruginosa TaxID=287 RepID=UPI0012987C8C|nr:hypothetical protein [Pseudomonas aeruginosa]MBX6708237.1 hypothetical protein [Pseudomonas aeruginosa]MCY0316955.1 hypothetical protein [Pseudomonas aeruginosa]MCY0323004.1 hypothetical protein [Pseudomonas aeruginosa]MCY0390081.1 hypothetical protein [Pseudomonas aeruginosa]MCY0432941.1 hypothetical protein [Pseudomonas aeruginosa]
MIGPHGSPGKLVSSHAGFPVRVSPNVLTVVIQALQKAWAEICSDPVKHLAPVTPGNPEEDRYTDAICELLLYYLYDPSLPVNGFTSDVFESVERGANLSNFNLGVINKQPDLVIRLANSPLVNTRRYVGIFAETKVVSKKKALSNYTRQGVSRFVRGDYAWAMQDGIMIAYRKQPTRQVDALDESLKKDVSLLTQEENSKHLLQSNLPIPACGKSTHERRWTYQAGGAPGEIRLWHLWAFDIP